MLRECLVARSLLVFVSTEVIIVHRSVARIFWKGGAT